jgi:hypothetical protein
VPSWALRWDDAIGAGGETVSGLRAGAVDHRRSAK